MVTNSSSITESGYALDARQNNGDIEDSLRNKILTLQTQTNQLSIRRIDKTYRFENTGWYRIAEQDFPNVANLQGNVSMPRTIIVYSDFNNYRNEYHEIFFYNTYNSPKLEEHISHNKRVFDQIRYVSNINKLKTFFDVHYTGSLGEIVHIIIDKADIGFYTTFPSSETLVPDEFDDDSGDSIWTTLTFT